MIYLDDILNNCDNATIEVADRFSRCMGRTHRYNVTPFGYLPKTAVQVILKDDSKYRFMAGHGCKVKTNVNGEGVEVLDADSNGLTWVVGNEVRGLYWADVLKITFLEMVRL